MVKMRVGGASNQSLKNRLLANKGDRLAWKVNGLKPYWFTVTLKPIRKITQFIT
jgi:glycosyltransferase